MTSKASGQKVRMKGKDCVEDMGPIGVKRGSSGGKGKGPVAGGGKGKGPGGKAKAKR
jgi:hypothetical protein